MKAPFLGQGLALLAWTAASPAVANTVKLPNKPPFRNVTVIGFRVHRVVFRGVSQQCLHKPLREVEWFAIDGQAELNAAERAAVAP